MSSVKIAERTTLLKNLATKHGFLSCGVSKSGFLSDEAIRLDNWLKHDYHASMKWMEGHYDKRLDTTKLVEDSTSVISLTFNYYPPEQQRSGIPKIAKYAYGEDYHFVIKEKLRALVNDLTQHIGEFNARVFVDSAPVMERAWAQKSGLGWIGKHSLLLTKTQGSFYFLAEIICDVDFQYDQPVTDHCGNCTACIDACPTDAIVANKIVDSNKCISYLTIELKDEIPAQFATQMDEWIFGCDVCQDVCPWNRFSKPHTEQRFNPSDEVLNNTYNDWSEITNEVFNKVFKKSAVKRTKFSGFLRNLRFIKADR